MRREPVKSRFHSIIQLSLLPSQHCHTMNTNGSLISPSAQRGTTTSSRSKHNPHQLSIIVPDPDQHHHRRCYPSFPSRRYRLKAVPSSLGATTTPHMRLPPSILKQHCKYTTTTITQQQQQQQQWFVPPQPTNIRRTSSNSSSDDSDDDSSSSSSNSSRKREHVAISASIETLNSLSLTTKSTSTTTTATMMQKRHRIVSFDATETIVEGQHGKQQRRGVRWFGDAAKSAPATAVSHLYPIPSRQAYTAEEHATMYTSPAQLARDVQRNALEYRYDGWTMATVTEEHDMVYYSGPPHDPEHSDPEQPSGPGQYIHPVHYYVQQRLQQQQHHQHRQHRRRADTGRRRSRS